MLTSTSQDPRSSFRIWCLFCEIVNWPERRLPTSPNPLRPGLIFRSVFSCWPELFGLPQVNLLGCVETLVCQCTESVWGRSLPWATPCASAANRATRSKDHRRERAWTMEPGWELNPSATVRRTSLHTPFLLATLGLGDCTVVTNRTNREVQF